MVSGTGPNTKHLSVLNIGNTTLILVALTTSGFSTQSGGDTCSGNLAAGEYCAADFSFGLSGDGASVRNDLDGILLGRL